MKVLKFGGTSVGSVQSIQTLLNILKNEGTATDKPVVVLSAMSGVTNLLIAMAEDAAKGNDFTASLAELEKRHFDVVKSLLDIQNQNPAFTKLKLHFNNSGLNRLAKKPVALSISISFTNIPGMV